MKTNFRLIYIYILILSLFSLNLAQEKVTKWNIWSDSLKISKVVSPKSFIPLEILPFPDNPDVQLYSSNNPQTENSIAINPYNLENLLVTTNGRLVIQNGVVTNIHQTHFYSNDGGANWSGSEDNPNGISTWGDPVALFNTNGDAFYVTLGNPAGIYVLKSTDGGSNWGSTVNADPLNSEGDDKEHAMTDLSGTYPNNIYAAWTDFNATNVPVVYTRSTNGGSSFSSTRTTLYSGDDRGQGTNIAVGPGGEVYIAFANYTNGSLPESGIRFTKSTNGGQSFTTANLAFNISGIRLSNGGRPEFNNTRVNSFPSMAVDCSNGARRGWIYIVYADRNTGDSDIYFRRSINSGSNWSPAIRVNNDIVGNGKQQWFPSISVDTQMGTIYISFYNMDSTGFLTARYVAMSNDGGNSFINYRVSDIRFTPHELGGYYSDGYMGDYYEIVANAGKAYATWSDDRTGTFQAYVSRLDGALELIVDQQLTNGSSVDSIGHWQGGPDFVTYSVPDTFLFIINSKEVLRGAQIIISGEKYNKWSKDDTVTNHREFLIDTNFPNRLVSTFDPTNPNITARNNLISAPGSDGGTIGFKDPWFIDYADPLYGNKLRNRGMKDYGSDKLEFYDRSSPFHPDFNIPYNGLKYLGAFLNQQPDPLHPESPYYSIRALSEQIIPLNGQNITWYFQGWSGHPDSVVFQNPNQTETAVVFKANNAVAKANYKGHMISSFQTATGYNNGHRMMKYGGTYHLVYEDYGNIYYTTSTDLITWAAEQLLSDGQGFAHYPSIAADVKGVHIVWSEVKNNTTYLISYESLGGGWITFTNFSPAKECHPIVETDYSTGVPKRICVWEGSDGLYYSRASEYYWFLIPSKIPNTTASCQFPTIQLRSTPWGMAYQNNNKIYYMTYNWPNTWSSPVQKSSSSTYNRHPSITAEYTDYAYYWLAWDAVAAMPPSHSIMVYRSKTGTYYSFSSYNKLYYYPSIRSDETYLPPPQPPNPNLSLTFEEQNGHDVYYTTFNNVNYQWNSLELINGNGGKANIATNYNHVASDIVLTSNSSLPFNLTLVKKSALLKETAGIISTYNYSRQIIFDLSKHPEIVKTSGDIGGEISVELLPYKLNNIEVDFVALKDSSDVDGFFSSSPFSAEKQILNISFIVSANNLDIKNIKTISGSIPLFKIDLLTNEDNKLLDGIYLFTVDSLKTLLTTENKIDRSINITLNNSHNNKIYIGERILKNGLDFKPVHIEKYEIRDQEAEKQNINNDQNMKYVVNTAIPDKYELYQNYPNPFNPVTQLSYDLPRACNVSLKIYNTTGQLINEIVNGYKEAGHYQAMFDGTHLAGGIYLYRLEAGAF